MRMTLSINCKDAGDPVCTHTMYGETEEESLKNAKEHGIKENGHNEKTWKDEMSHNIEHFRSLIKKS
jgi:predicted small metal-binding protein